MLILFESLLYGLDVGCVGAQFPIDYLIEDFE